MTDKAGVSTSTPDSLDTETPGPDQTFGAELVGNQAAAVRGPKHAVTKGHDAGALARAEARKLLESIDTGALAGDRDRALLSVMLYARVSAVLGMRRQDTTSGRGAGVG